MAYWGDVAVLYEPYYAYEELMAAFRDEPGSAHSILASAEHLTRRIAGRDLRAVRVNPQQRAAVLASYEGTAPARPGPAEAGLGGNVYLAYRRREDSGRVGAIYDALAASLGSDRVFMDVGTRAGSRLRLEG